MKSSYCLCGRKRCPRICERVCHCPAGRARARELLNLHRANRHQRRLLAAEPELHGLLKQSLLDKNQRDYHRRYGRPKQFPVHREDISKPRPFKLFHIF